MAGLLAGTTVPTATAVGPYDGDSTVLTVVGANNVGQKDVPLDLLPYTTAIADISAGADHVLAVTDQGRLYAWGDNSQGEGEILVPQQGWHYKAVSAGFNYSLALTGSGRVEAWGSSKYDLTFPPASLEGRTVTAISAGGTFALALDSTGRVHAWGDHEHGQRDIPQALFSKKVVKISAGYAHAVAVTEDKEVFAWGHGLFGETAVPASLQGRTIEEIDAGGAHTVALMGDGSIVGWGDNTHGQLNTPTTSDRWYHVSAGNGFTIASGNKESKVRVWGDGADTTFANVPPNSVPVSRVSAGGEFAVYGNALIVPETAPQISGTARVGEVLTGTPGTWVPRAPTFTPSWYVDGSAVGREFTYTPTADQVGKKVSFTTLARREGYQVSIRFAEVTVLPGLMAKQQPKPTISGFAQVGQVLTATSSFSPTPDRVHYDWHLDGQLTQATGEPTYTVQPGDLGKRITVHAFAYKDGYERAGSGFSDATPSVTVTPKIVVTNAPTIVGTPRVDQAVTVTAPTSEPAATSVSYQWMRDGAPIVGATGTSYTPSALDRGKPLSVESTSSRDAYEGATSRSAAVQVGAGAFTSVGVPTVTGNAAVGSRLQAAVTSTPASESTQFDWYAGDTLRSSGPSTYEATPADAGLRLTVVARVMRGGYDTVTTPRSTPTAVVAGKQPDKQPDPQPTPAVKVVSAASVSGVAVAGGVLSANGPTTDVPGTATYQWLRDGQPIPGATTQTLTLGPDDVGRRIAVTATVQRTGWTPASSTSVPTAAVSKAVPVVKGRAKTKKARTVLKLTAVAARLPAIGTKVTVAVGKKVVRAKLVAGRATVKLPLTKKPLKVTIAETSTTAAVTVKVKVAK